jgi:hypothetical protein
MIKIPCIPCEATNKERTPLTMSPQEAGETGREGGREGEAEKD